MSLRDKLRARVHRWMDRDWSANDHGGVGPGLGGSLDTPSAVDEMAADAVAESDRPEQEREREESEPTSATPVGRKPSRLRERPLA